MRSALYGYICLSHSGRWAGYIVSQNKGVWSVDPNLLFQLYLLAITM